LTLLIHGATMNFNKQSNNFVSLTPSIFGDAPETTHLTTVEWHDAYIKDEL